MTDELREFVNSRTGDASVYSTPAEYPRDLIRRDMVAQRPVARIMGGIDDIKHSRFSDSSIVDIANEKEAQCRQRAPDSMQS